MELNRVRVRQAGTVEMLRDLRRVPCMDCGGRFAPYQMDFDHRDPAAKSFNVMTGRAMLMSTAKLMLEVAKCDIVCANCHRTRTQRMRLRQVPVLVGRCRRIEERLYWRGHQRKLNELRDVPCSDCGGAFPSWVMEFDHRDPAQKSAAVSRMIGRAGVARILAEAAKCDIVCANCHRMRTYRQQEALLERE